MQSEGSRTPYSHPHNLTISQENLNKISKIHTTDCFLKYLKSLTWKTKREFICFAENIPPENIFHRF